MPPLQLHPRLDPPTRWRARFLWAVTVALAAGSALCAWLRPPPLPPLPDDANGYEACVTDPYAEGCAAWPIVR